MKTGDMRFSNAGSDFRVPYRSNTWAIGCLLLFVVLWIYTLLGTNDLNNWLLENTLVFLALGYFYSIRNRHVFSDLSIGLITLFMCLHVYGSMFTYAENPFGFYLQELFQTERNHYDRIVHFSFGFFLAYPLREMFLSWFHFPRWVAWVMPIELTLSVSGLYELIEWAVADVFFPEQGIAYLGTQGDVWDAQKDMFLAVLGAIIATSIISFIKHEAKYWGWDQAREL